MMNRGSILLVSTNPELHQVLEIIASTYNLRFLGADAAGAGIDLFKAKVPNCVIFDLDVLRDYRHRTLLKKKIGESGVPVLFLNDNENGAVHQGNSQKSLKLEPIVKFVVDSQNGARRTGNQGLVSRLLTFCRLRRNACAVVE
ncbi:MAG: hypothetical protein HY801_08315 [Candidatus Lindowbacteria bacterium]|nr:hypothetical protein [Candidatus Lindowbacteria bacterium]